MPEINLPEINLLDVIAEVEVAFAEHERALTENDVETLDRLFLGAATTVRYGVGENLYGYGEITAFRAARPSVGLERTLEQTLIPPMGATWRQPGRFSAGLRWYARSAGKARYGCGRWMAGGWSLPMSALWSSL